MYLFGKLNGFRQTRCKIEYIHRRLPLRKTFWLSQAYRFLGLPVVLASTIGLALALTTKSPTPAIFFASILFHLRNLEALVFRSVKPKTYLISSLCLRSLSILLLASLVYADISHGAEYRRWAAGLIVLGGALQFDLVKSMGLEAVYYGSEITNQNFARLNSFWFKVLKHPIHFSIFIQLLGVSLLVVTPRDQLTLVLIAHFVFNFITPLAESQNWHLTKISNEAVADELTDPKERQLASNLGLELSAFLKGLRDRKSCVHRYVDSCPKPIKDQVELLNSSASVMQTIREKVGDRQITCLHSTNEVYLSVPNHDNAGDHGLFAPHYDGALRFLPGFYIFRCIFYLKSQGEAELILSNSKLRVRPQTGDFVILDFNRELHRIDCQKSESSSSERVLLKCNYLIGNPNQNPFLWVSLKLNNFIFFVVKASMEYSKSPKTLGQRMVGRICNWARLINNIG